MKNAEYVARFLETDLGRQIMESAVLVEYLSARLGLVRYV